MALTSVLQTQRTMIAANDARMAPQVTQASRENELENQRKQDKMIDLLVKIEKNTAGAMAGAGKAGGKPEAGGILGIGALGTALAVGLGAIVGYIKGYVTLLGKLAKVLVPEKWIAAIKTGFDTVVDFFGKVGNLIDKGFQKIKSFFVFDDASAIGKMITALKDGLTKFFAPIGQGIEMIKDGSAAVQKGITFVSEIVGKVKSFFSAIAAYGNEFAKVFSGTVKIFSKLAIPLTVIMTIWDTVKGVIAGFEKDGIIGGIAGAVKGFFNSLIFAPLDMLKSAISWVLGVFGFDKAEAALDSFSFETMFSEMIDTLAKPFIWVRDKALELWNNFSWDETWGKITGFITESIDSVVGGFSRLKDGVIEWWNSWTFSDVLDSISKQVTEIGDAIANWFKEKINKIKSFFGFGKGANESDEAKSVQKTSMQIKSAESMRGDGKNTYVDVDPETKKRQEAIKAKNEADIKGLVAKGYNEQELRGENRAGSDTKNKIRRFFGMKETGGDADFVDPKSGKTLAEIKREEGAVDLRAKYGDDDDVPTARKISPTAPETGKQVSIKSAEAEDSKIKAMQLGSQGNKTAIVNAPVTNNNQNNIIRSNIRNQDSTLTRYYNSKLDF